MRSQAQEADNIVTGQSSPVATRGGAGGRQQRGRRGQRRRRVRRGVLRARGPLEGPEPLGGPRRRPVRLGAAAPRAGAVV